MESRCLKGLPNFFEKQDSVAAVKATYAQQMEELYAEIGRLTTHVQF